MTKLLRVPLLGLALFSLLLVSQPAEARLVDTVLDCIEDEEENGGHHAADCLEFAYGIEDPNDDFDNPFDD